MRTYRLLLLPYLSVACAHARPPVPDCSLPPGDATLTAHVVDDSTGRAISGAWLEFRTPCLTVHSVPDEGPIRVQGIAAGDYTPKALALLYRPHDTAIHLEPGATRALTIGLRRGPDYLESCRAAPECDRLLATSMSVLDTTLAPADFRRYASFRLALALALRQRHPAGFPNICLGMREGDRGSYADLPMGMIHLLQREGAPLYQFSECTHNADGLVVLRQSRQVAWQWMLDDWHVVDDSVDAVDGSFSVDPLAAGGWRCLLRHASDLITAVRCDWKWFS